MPDEDPILYSVEEAADLLKVSPWMIRTLIQRNQLGSIQIGARRLIPREDIDTLIARLRDEREQPEAHHE